MTRRMWSSAGYARVDLRFVRTLPAQVSAVAAMRINLSYNTSLDLGRVATNRRTAFQSRVIAKEPQ